jgi:streptogramin lyase
MRHPRFIIVGMGLVLAMASPVATVVQAIGPAFCQSGCATAVVPPIAASPFGITSGPRGSVWFSLDHAIGRIDQRGGITVYPVPTVTEHDVGWLTLDPAGAVWFS